MRFAPASAGGGGAASVRCRARGACRQDEDCARACGSGGGSGTPAAGLCAGVERPKALDIQLPNIDVGRLGAVTAGEELAEALADRPRLVAVPPCGGARRWHRCRSPRLRQALRLCLRQLVGEGDQFQVGQFHLPCPAVSFKLPTSGCTHAPNHRPVHVMVSVPRRTQCRI